MQTFCIVTIPKSQMFRRDFKVYGKKWCPSVFSYWLFKFTASYFVLIATSGCMHIEYCRVLMLGKLYLS